VRGRIALLLAVALVATMLVSPAAADPDTSRLQQLQRELRDLEATASQERAQLGTLDAEQEALVAEQQRAEARLRQIEAELSLAVDIYNGAVEALEQVQAELAATTAELATLVAEIDGLQGNVVDHVRRLHKLGPSIEFTVIVGATDPADIGFRSSSLRHIISVDQVDIERLSAATARASALEDRLAEQEADATELAATVEAELRTVEATYERNADEMAELEATLARVEAQLRAQRAVVSDTDQALDAARRAVAEEQARIEAERARIEAQRRAEREAAERAASERAAAERAAAERAAAQRSTSSSTAPATSSPAPAPAPAPAPSTRRSADVAVATALAQLGKPYVWGANGPSSFDCSGLTSFSWRSAGVTIPRTSRGQFSGLTRVSRAQLQPGDLVFEYSPVSHVSMYIGNNTIVEASRPGVPVRTASLSSRSPVGYARP
jgi:peptidoglycan DL-endopeptidase CwlO